MDIEFKVRLSEAEMKYWIGYAVLHGWKRPRSWSNWERRNAVMYGMNTHLHNVAKVVAVCEAEAQSEDKAYGGTFPRPTENKLYGEGSADTGPDGAA